MASESSSSSTDQVLFSIDDTLHPDLIDFLEKIPAFHKLPDSLELRLALLKHYGSCFQHYYESWQHSYNRVLHTLTHVLNAFMATIELWDNNPKLKTMTTSDPSDKIFYKEYISRLTWLYHYWGNIYNPFDEFGNHTDVNGFLHDNDCRPNEAEEYYLMSLQTLEAHQLTGEFSELVARNQAALAGCYAFNAKYEPHPDQAKRENLYKKSFTYFEFAIKNCTNENNYYKNNSLISIINLTRKFAEVLINYANSINDLSNKKTHLLRAINLLSELFDKHAEAMSYVQKISPRLLTNLTNACSSLLAENEDLKEKLEALNERMNRTEQQASSSTTTTTSSQVQVGERRKQTTTESSANKRNKPTPGSSSASALHSIWRTTPPASPPPQGNTPSGSLSSTRPG